MPRKRRMSVSPQKQASNPSIPATLSSSATLPLSSAMSGNKEEMLSSMCEMFPNLEPSLIEMVLSEYKEIEIVMDYLLELSTVAKMEAKLESTGFEKIMANLDDLHMNSQSSENEDTVTGKAEGYLEDTCIDETACSDLDMLLDEALDRYGLTNPEDIYSTVQPESLVSNASISGVMSEQIQSISHGHTSFQTEYMENIAEPPTSLAGAEELEKSYDVTIAAPSPVGPKITELEKTESEFKTLPGTNDILLHNEKIITTSSQRHFASHEIPAVPSVPPKTQINWNPLASAFFPASNPQGSFITPVFANPIQWSYPACAPQPSRLISYNTRVPSAYVWNPFPPAQWSAENVRPINVPKPKPQINAQISKKVTRLVGKVIIILRGAPGSGKSTLARIILEQNPTGVILSTDDYFYQNGKYQFDVNCLSEAHDWNQKRGMEIGCETTLRNLHDFTF